MCSVNNPPVIRAVLAESAAILTRIHGECFPHYWNPEAFTDFFAVPGTMGLLAEAPEPAGMAVLRVQHEQADIITLAVSPAYRRRGIARLLLAQLIVMAKKLGAKSLFLDVEDGNAAALALYQTHGFTQINRRPHYYKQKDGSFTDALVMMRKLG